MRTLVIGDVHGCIDEFRELVGMAQPGDRVVQLGDLMDRGPAPAECVRFARERGVEVVLGNHDEKHLRWRIHEIVRAATGKKNPIRWMPLVAQEQNLLLSDEDVAWLTARPLMLDLGSCIATHAGFEPGLPIDKQRPKKMIRVRYVDGAGMMVSSSQSDEDTPEPPEGDAVIERPDVRTQPPNTFAWYEKWTGKSVIFGHAVQGYLPRAHGIPNGTCIGVDTGCCYGGRLTAAVVDAGIVTFLSVPAARVYYDKHVPPVLAHTKDLIKERENNAQGSLDG